MKFKQFVFLTAVALLLSVMTHSAMIGNLSAQEVAPPRSLEDIRTAAEGAPLAYHLPLPGAAPAAPQEAITSQSQPPDWTRLTYESFQNSRWNVYAANWNGSGVVQLTHTDAVDAAPSFRHGAAEFAFISTRDGNYEIYKAAVNGSYTQRLTYDGASDSLPNWSRANDRIAFQSNRAGSVDIYVMNQDGGGLQRLTFVGGYNGAPSWSPDGARIVFASNRRGFYELWIMNADGSNQYPIPNTANSLYPSWSPDGERIAFVRDHNQDGFLEIWLINVDGSGETIWLNNGHQTDHWFPTWSPDGRYLAFTQTNWVLYQGQFYWTVSYVRIRNVEQPHLSYSSPHDDRAWRSHWAATDVTPPSLCTVNVAAQQRWPQISLTFTAQDGDSGMRAYEYQTRAPGQSWQTFASPAGMNSVVYEGPLSGAAEFRCRGGDMAGNWRSWEGAAVAATQIDAASPTSRVAPLPAFTAEASVMVHWSGSDQGSGIADYTIFVREGEDGDWTAWQDQVVTTSAQFSGAVGQTYYFRSQARDLVGHIERWQPAPQTAVTFYDALLMVDLRDNRGYPVSGAAADVAPAAVAAVIDPGLLRAYLSQTGAYTVTLTAPGYGAAPPIYETIAADRARLAVFPPVDNAVYNGDFEQPDLSGWTVSGAGVSLSGEAHTGWQSVALPDDGDGASLSQGVTIPADAHAPTLSFLYRLSGGGPLTAQIGPDVVFSTAAPAPEWRHAWVDLAAYAGQSITLTFAFAGPGETAHLDDVSLGSWTTPQITAVIPDVILPGETMQISGLNFLPEAEIYLGESLLSASTWLSSSLIAAEIPEEQTPGSYTLTVRNPSGATAVVDVTVETHALFLPVVARDSGKAATPGFVRSAWLTLGYDVGRTGYQAGDGGASRYGLAWEAALPYPSNSPLKQIAVADGVLVASSDNPFRAAGVVALDAYTGEIIWQYPFYNKDSVNPPTIGHGAVYFQQGNHNGDSYLFSLDLYTGHKNWQTPFGAQWQTYLAPLVVGDGVYMNAGSYGGLQANAAAGGQFLWSVNLPQHDNWTPAYADGVIYAWVAGNFYALNMNSGAHLWGLNVGGAGGDRAMNTAPVIAGRTAFVVSPTQLTAIDLDTRQARWSRAGDHGDTMVAVAGGEVYALNDGVLQVSRVHDGALLWQFSQPDSLIHAPVVTDKYVYVATAHDTFVLDRATREVVWQAPQGGWLSVADGFLYIAQPDKTITAYRAQQP